MQVQHTKHTIGNGEILPTTPKLFSGRELVTVTLPNGQQMVTVQSIKDAPAPLLLNIEASNLEIRISKITYERPELTTEKKQYLDTQLQELSLIKKELLKITQQESLSMENKAKVYTTNSLKLDTIKNSLQVFVREISKHLT